MIDRDAAKALVLRYLSTRPSKYGGGRIVMDDNTLEFDIAWMFSWTLDRIPRPDYGCPGQGSWPVGGLPLAVSSDRRVDLGPFAVSRGFRQSRMVEISLSGSSEEPGRAIGRGYSTGRGHPARPLAAGW